MNTYREFDNETEAQKFASECINRQSPYLTIHSWRAVRVEKYEETV